MDDKFCGCRRVTWNSLEPAKIITFKVVIVLFQVLANGATYDKNSNRRN